MLPWCGYDELPLETGEHIMIVDLSNQPIPRSSLGVAERAQLENDPILVAL